MSKFQVFLDEQPAVEAMEVEVEKKPERKVLSCLSNVLPNNEVCFYKLIESITENQMTQV